MKYLSIVILIATACCSTPAKEYRWSRSHDGLLLFRDKEEIGLLKEFTARGIASSDQIEELGDGIFLVKRTYSNTSDSVLEARLFFDFVRHEKPSYYMIPAVNYNGNKWGDGDNDNKDNPGGKLLSYSYRRTPIPAMTYSEAKTCTVGIWCDSLDFDKGVSCAFLSGEEGCVHRLIVPEEEMPLSYHDRNTYIPGWKRRMCLQPRETYSLSAIIVAGKIENARASLNKALSFAWNRYEKSCTQPETIDCRNLWALSCRFAREHLWAQTDEFEGFSIGLWNQKGNYVQRPVLRYEIGWSGQNASLANALLQDYLFTGDSASLDKGMRALDSWAKYATLHNGLFITHFDDILFKNTGSAQLDASNLSTAAFQYLDAYRLAQECGIAKPFYKEIGLNICQFVLGQQETSGRYGRLWNTAGQCIGRDGTIGSSFIPPIIKAFQLNGQDAYLESAIKAYDFYIGAFIHDGFTTTGAIDGKCIDKESAAPLLRSSILLYEITRDETYLSYAENLSLYLSSWLWHYTGRYPGDTDMQRYKYNTFAATSVSTLYHHLSPFGLYFVPDWIKLAEYTGNPIWKAKAKAVWRNATQLVSDGELTMHGVKRPPGSQNEACFQAHWQRFGAINDWLVAWPCAYRMEVLRNIKDWDVLNR